MTKKQVTRIFVAAAVVAGVGLVVGIAAVWVALASDAIDFGGDHYVDVNGASGAWIALALLIVATLAILAATAAAVVSWLGALLNTRQLEDQRWFWSLLASGLLGFGVVAMLAYLAAGPDGMQESVAS
jgi:hypothetical protein